MKFYLLTDLEGPAGVSRWAQTREANDTPAKLGAMGLLTGEINAAINGILDADKDAEILVLDGHGSGGIVFERLHPRAAVIMHGPDKNKNAYQLNASFDALFFVGQHAMAGVPDAPLCHTYSSRVVENYKLNGVPIGETGCRAALAGSFGVPTVFLSGDDKACDEARLLVPDMITVATKTGLGVELALHLSAGEAQTRIRAGAAQAVQKTRARAIAPYIIAPPYTMEVRVYEEQSLHGYLQKGAEAIDERTAVKRSENLMDLFV